MRARILALSCLLAACGTSSSTPDAATDASGAVDATPDVSADAPTFPPDPEVTTSLGVLRGTRDEGYQAFRGIPYAMPPVGALRWRAPVAFPRWDGVRDASHAGSSCAQSAFGLLSVGTEDCLFVNVHTPDPRPANAPVLVWIHGGAFVFGDGLQTDGGTAGDILAKRYGLVVVSMNYRLGAFGFLANTALGSTGNEGFQDQQLALRWVHDHIASFGGNPDDVTLAGESAGGISVCLHLTAPGSRGLFHRAISESGPCDDVLSTHTEQLAAGRPLVAALHCETAPDEAACLREKPFADVRTAAAPGGDLLALLAGNGRVWWPSIDGSVLTGSFRARVEAHDVANVPTIVGWNADEGTLFVGLAEFSGTPIDQAAYDRATTVLSTVSHVDLARIRAAYPVSAYANPGAALAAALGHAALACPARRAARLLDAAGLDVRTYRFSYPRAAFQLGLTRPLGAFHSAEIQFVFGHPAAIARHEFMGEEVALHDAMSGAWARFVRTGDPSGAGLTWPLYDPATDVSVGFDTTIAPASAPDTQACALWE